MSQSWRRRAACRDTPTNTFYPDRYEPTAPAKRICNGGPGQETCPVRQACLDYALDNDERWGVWGGKSARERRRLKRGQRVA